MFMLVSADFSSWGTPPPIYRQYFTAAECRMLDDSPLDSALNEIGLLRILLLRLLAAAHRKRPLSIKRHISMLVAFSGAGLIMASLVRFHDKHFGRGSSLLDALDELDPNDL